MRGSCYKAWAEMAVTGTRWDSHVTRRSVGSYSFRWTKIEEAKMISRLLAEAKRRMKLSLTEMGSRIGT